MAVGDDIPEGKGRMRIEMTASLGHLGIIATLLGLIWSSGAKLEHIDDIQDSQAQQITTVDTHERTDAAEITALTSAQAATQAEESTAISGLNGQMAQLAQEMATVLATHNNTNYPADPDLGPPVAGVSDPSDISGWNIFHKPDPELTPKGNP